MWEGEVPPHLCVLQWGHQPVLGNVQNQSGAVAEPSVAPHGVFCSRGSGAEMPGGITRQYHWAVWPGSVTGWCCRAVGPSPRERCPLTREAAPEPPVVRIDVNGMDMTRFLGGEIDTRSLIF